MLATVKWNKNSLRLV